MRDRNTGAQETKDRPVQKYIRKRGGRCNNEKQKTYLDHEILMVGVKTHSLRS